MPETYQPVKRLFALALKPTKVPSRAPTFALLALMIRAFLVTMTSMVATATARKILGFASIHVLIHTITIMISGRVVNRVSEDSPSP